MRRTLGISCVTLVVGLLAACTGSGSSKDKPPAIGTLPTISDTSQIVFPLDAYLQTDDQYSASLKAVSKATARCMSDFGFTYVSHYSHMPSWTDNKGVFGFVNLHQAEQQGYRWYVPKLIDVDPPAPKTTLPPDEVSVLQGKVESFGGKTVPRGGCDQVASDAVQANEPGSGVNVQFVQGLIRDAYAKTESDSRVVDAFAKWGACMKNAGYPYAKPGEAADAAVSMSNSAQINMAVSDFHCREPENLIGLEVAVDAAYQKLAIDRNAQALADIKKSIDTEQLNASHILSQ